MQIGDHVSIINETLSGTITKIEGNTYYVDTGDFEFPYQKNELVEIKSKEEITNLYLEHSPHHATIKPEDLPSAKSLTETERIEELGRVRGKRNTKGVLEFDLHIHDLLVKHSHMTPGEMLNYQLDYAVHCLEEAIKKREPAIVFIHGVGKGVLKSELHKIIGAYDFSYHDGFMQEYGVGATRVELRG